MREASIAQALSEATGDVLEKMFFTGVLGETDALGETGSPIDIEVRLPFEGSRRGVLMLGIERDAARTLAADFLGLEPGDTTSDKQVREVVGELANMICGDALSRAQSGALILGAPEVMLSEAWNVPRQATLRSFDLGSGRLTVALAFEDGADA